MACHGATSSRRHQKRSFQKEGFFALPDLAVQRTGISSHSADKLILSSLQSSLERFRIPIQIPFDRNHIIQNHFCCKVGALGTSVEGMTQLQLTRHSDIASSRAVVSDHINLICSEFYHKQAPKRTPFKVLVQSETPLICSIHQEECRFNMAEVLQSCLSCMHAHALVVSEELPQDD